MLILNGGDSMEVQLISTSNKQKFKTELNEVLSELKQQEKEIIDIKYQTTLDERSGASWINHSALVVYK